MKALRCIVCIVLLISANLLSGKKAAAQFYRNDAPAYGSFGVGNSGYSPETGYSTPGAYARPVVSPYLNLIGRNSAAVNYYGIVRPQLEFRAVQQRQGSRLQQLESREGDAKPDDFALPHTGHRCFFLNYSHYYGVLH